MPAPILYIAGAGALLLVDGKKKRRKGRRYSRTPSRLKSVPHAGAYAAGLSWKQPPPPTAALLGPAAFGSIAWPAAASKRHVAAQPRPLPPAAESLRPEDLLSPNGRATLGCLHQIEYGDTSFEVCVEALFGSRDVVLNPAGRQAAMELLILVHSGRWNQILYGRDTFSENHHGSTCWGQKEVSFGPIYIDNYKRLSDSLPPLNSEGRSFALIWIPMINLDAFDLYGRVTTEGMSHPDTENGIGGNMIDPPAEILSLVERDNNNAERAKSVVR